MQIILTEDIVGLGDIGEEVKVKAGYARNYLIPRGLAIESGSRKAGLVAHKRRQIDAKRVKIKGEAEELKKKIESLVLNFELRLGATGKAFGSIGVRDIAKKMGEEGFTVDRRRIFLSEPIRRKGEHSVDIKLHAEVMAKIRLLVEQQDAGESEVKEEVSKGEQGAEDEESPFEPPFSETEESTD